MISYSFFRSVPTQISRRDGCGFLASLITLALLTTLYLFTPNETQAKDVGLSSLGAVGGLRIPSAYTLSNGEIAISKGNELDYRLGDYELRQNYSVGFGLGHGLEVFGRIANYQNPRVDSDFVTGPRDLSANFKWQVPLGKEKWPTIAIGGTDIRGGAVYFRSMYAVASDVAGPLRWSLGYGKSQARNGARVLNGLFGGAELRLWDTRATALMESDGDLKYMGLRYYSRPLDWLGQGQIVGSIQRTMDSPKASSNSFNLSLVIPLQVDSVARQAEVQRSLTSHTLLSVDAPGDRLNIKEASKHLANALYSAGFDRVRVGISSAIWQVQYENQRYLYNEADALGIALGLAAELAPPDLKQIRVSTLRSGVEILQTSISVDDWRNYLRSGYLLASRGTLNVRPPGEVSNDNVHWLEGHMDRPRTRFRLTFKPLVNYSVATEWSLVDYSLGLQTRASAFLWPGAQVYADVVTAPLIRSNLTSEGRVFNSLVQPAGLKNIALQQSFWIGKRIFNSVGVGRYQYRHFGLEGESTMFVPDRDDTVHLRAQWARDPEGTASSDLRAWSLIYRWQARTNTWLEGAVNQYTDGSRGPSVMLTRWFDDVALQLYVNRGAVNTFVGASLNIPFGPRQGMAAKPVQLSTGPRFSMGLRSLLTSSQNTGNWVDPQAVRTVSLAFEPQNELLNEGRLSEHYFQSQAIRLRESFYVYGRQYLRPY